MGAIHHICKTRPGLEGGMPKDGITVVRSTRNASLTARIEKYNFVKKDFLFRRVVCQAIEKENICPLIKTSKKLRFLGNFVPPKGQVSSWTSREGGFTGLFRIYGIMRSESL